MKTVKVLLGRIWGMLRHPLRTRKAVREEGWSRTLLYFLVLLCVPAVILLIGGAVVYPRYMAIYFGEYQAIGWMGVGLVLPLVLILGFIALMLGALILHLFVWIFGGRQGLRQTFKALAYGSTPWTLTLWFPPIALATMIWSIVLTVIGLKETHNLSTVRAILPVVLAPAIIIGLALLVRVIIT